jgi:hypothetical protein
LEYFSRFPVITYANTLCRDITHRVKILNAVASDPHAYQPFEIKHHERPDTIADLYYTRDDLEWLVYLSADVIDPYHGWYLTDRDFNEFIKKKYGSTEEAQQSIRHWQMNWYDFDAEISPAAYDALDPTLKKYYEPRYGSYNNTIAWKRRIEDWTTHTNMVVTLSVANTFSVGERVKFSTGATVTGQAEVAWANSSVIKVIHVSGNTDPTNTVTGVSSNNTATITSRTFTSNTISVDERPYWNPVTYYEWEQDQNEKKKNIKLLDRTYTDAVEKEFEKLMDV